MAKKIKAEIIAPTIEMPRVEIMDLNEVDLCPKTKEDFLKDLPEDTKDCYKIMAADFFYAQKQNALRMWHIGKIIHTLNGRGVDGVLEQAMAITQYKERALLYCVAVYKEFPDPNHISNLGKLLNWTSIRGLLKVHKKENREAICKRVLDGEITDNNIDTAIKAVVTDERKEKEKTEEKAPVGAPPKKLNATSVMTKAQNYLLETVKKIQQLELEVNDTFKYVWNRELVTDEAEFDECINAYGEVEKVVESLEKAVKSFGKTTKKACETDPYAK